MSFTFLRIFSAVALLAIVGLSLVPYATSYVSSSAVVNAPLVVISAPFSGVIEASTRDVSEPVSEGETLFILKNSQSQRAELQSRQTSLGSLSGEIAGIEQQLRDLLIMSDQLNERRQVQVEARMDWFLPRVAEANANIKRSNANLEKSQRNAARIALLLARGSATEIDLINAETELAVAEADLSQQHALRDRLQFERDMLGSDIGIDLSSSGIEQIDYRLEDLKVRVAELNARLAERQAQHIGLSNQISALEHEASRQENFGPTASTFGVIWEASAKSGAPVASGQQIAKVLDCSRRFLEVELPERHFENVPAGTPATVMLKGSEETFSANVIAAYGSGARPNREAQAASPRIEAHGGLRVIVGIGPADVHDSAVARSFCDIGRTAEVHFDLPEDSLGSRLARFFESFRDTEIATIGKLGGDDAGKEAN